MDFVYDFFHSRFFVSGKGVIFISRKGKQRNSQREAKDLRFFIFVCFARDFLAVFARDCFVCHAKGSNVLRGFTLLFNCT